MAAVWPRPFNVTASITAETIATKLIVKIVKIHVRISVIWVCAFLVAMVVTYSAMEPGNVPMVPMSLKTAQDVRRVYIAVITEDVSQNLIAAMISMTAETTVMKQIAYAAVTKLNVTWVYVSVPPCGAMV